MTFTELWNELEKEHQEFVNARIIADIEVKMIEEEHDKANSV